MRVSIENEILLQIPLKERDLMDSYITSRTYITLHKSNNTLDFL